VTAEMLVIVPARGRPGHLARFLEAFAATRQADTDLVVALDDDDRDAYDGVALPDGAWVTSAPRAWLGPKVNRLAVPAAWRYPVIGMLADDVVPETPGLDRLILGALQAPGIAWPADGRRSDIPEHPFISSAIIQALGWFYEPGLCHYWTDNVWADLGLLAGCLRPVPGAVVRHLHYAAAPGFPAGATAGVRRDRTYADAEENGRRDEAAYLAWRRNGLAADVAAVRAAIGATP
jgi:hypothetical protein